MESLQRLPRKLDPPKHEAPPPPERLHMKSRSHMKQGGLCIWWGGVVLLTHSNRRAVDRAGRLERRVTLSLYTQLGWAWTLGPRPFPPCRACVPARRRPTPGWAGVPPVCPPGFPPRGGQGPPAAAERRGAAERLLQLCAAVRHCGGLCGHRAAPAGGRCATACHVRCPNPRTTPLRFFFVGMEIPNP